MINIFIQKIENSNKLVLVTINNKRQTGKHEVMTKKELLKFVDNNFLNE